MPEIMLLLACSKMPLLSLLEPLFAELKEAEASIWGPCRELSVADGTGIADAAAERRGNLRKKRRVSMPGLCWAASYWGTLSMSKLLVGSMHGQHISVQQPCRVWQSLPQWCQLHVWAACPHLSSCLLWESIARRGGPHAQRKHQVG